MLGSQVHARALSLIRHSRHVECAYLPRASLYATLTSDRWLVTGPAWNTSGHLPCISSCLVCPDRPLLAVQVAGSKCTGT